MREVILYNDRVVITYNITDNPEHVRHMKENVIKTEEQIKHAAKSAFSFTPSSNIISIGAPKLPIFREFFLVLLQIIRAFSQKSFVAGYKFV